jgi:hydrogenase/urease accessory protein HupE
MMTRLVSAALLLAATPAFAHLDPAAHATGTADHHHPFIGLEPLVVAGLVVATIVAIGRLRSRQKAGTPRRKDRG